MKIFTKKYLAITNDKIDNIIKTINTKMAENNLKIQIMINTKMGETKADINSKIEMTNTKIVETNTKMDEIKKAMGSMETKMDENKAEMGAMMDILKEIQKKSEWGKHSIKITKQL